MNAPLVWETQRGHVRVSSSSRVKIQAFAFTVQLQLVSVAAAQKTTVMATMSAEVAATSAFVVLVLTTHNLNSAIRRSILLHYSPSTFTYIIRLIPCYYPIIKFQFIRLSIALFSL